MKEIQKSHGFEKGNEMQPQRDRNDPKRKGRPNKSKNQELKAQFIEEYLKPENNYSVTLVAEKLEMPRIDFYHWMSQDPEFKKIIDDVHDKMVMSMKLRAEAALHNYLEQINGIDPNVAIKVLEKIGNKIWRKEEIESNHTPPTINISFSDVTVDKEKE